MQLVMGIALGVVGTMVYFDPSMMADTFHWLGDLVSENKEKINGFKSVQ